jgi:hypothetical protein
MKLRLDLLEFLTPEDILEGALASVHRYDPEPNFSKTGVGSLRPATPEERAEEEARESALVEKLKKRQRESESRRKIAPLSSSAAAPPTGSRSY